MVEAAVDGRNRYFFWKEVDMMNNYHSDPPNMGVVKDPQSIANLLKQMYDTLYNSNPSIKANLTKNEDNIDMHVGQSMAEDYIVTEEQVIAALDKFKSDGQKGVISDHIIYGPRRLAVDISLFLTTARRHGFMPDKMLLYTTASIAKYRTGDQCSSDNYRGILFMVKINNIVILM